MQHQIRQKPTPAQVQTENITPETFLKLKNDTNILKYITISAQKLTNFKYTAYNTIVTLSDRAVSTV